MKIVILQSTVLKAQPVFVGDRCDTDVNTARFLVGIGRARYATADELAEAPSRAAILAAHPSAAALDDAAKSSNRKSK